jgi:ABC-type sulfate/molybdate transport systems ATPase subunit
VLKQRVALSTLDASVRAVLRAELPCCHAQVGALLITHDVQDVQVLAATIVMIERSQVCP